MASVQNMEGVARPSLNHVRYSKYSLQGLPRAPIADRVFQHQTDGDPGKEKPMMSQRLIFFLTICTAMSAQDSSLPATLSPRPEPTQTVALTVARNTPLQIALDREVRIRKAGQPIHGRLVQPVYAFDRLVVPAGTEVG